MKPLDLTKPIQTRDGRPAKFLHKFHGGGHTLVFVIGSGEKESIRYFNSEGESGTDQLINVPVKHVREYWVNLYQDDNKGNSYLHNTREAADHASNINRLACKKSPFPLKKAKD